MSAALQEFAGTGGELLKMVEQKWLGRTVMAMTEAIELSYETDDVLRPVMTKREVNHRFEILIKWFVTMRRDMGWAVPRILDTLPMALRLTLDGVDYDPEAVRKAWMAAGEALELLPDGPDLAPAAQPVDAIETEDLVPS